MARSILIVRLGALGDLVHALPAAAAIRAAWPDARIDWVVDGRYAALLELVPVINRTIVLGGRDGMPLLAVIRALRRARYDLAIDFQGLLKSAVLARLAGARETAGFIPGQLREPLAGAFYTRRVPADDSGHVVRKNLSLVEALGVAARDVASPLKVSPSAVPGQVRRLLGIGAGDRFAVINPGAGWPNKQWPADRFGAIAAHLFERHGVPSIVTWGPGEQAAGGRGGGRLEGRRAGRARDLRRGPGRTGPGRGGLHRRRHGPDATGVRRRHARRRRVRANQSVEEWPVGRR